MTAQPPREITCDADSLAADATAVEALARLQLGARRQGSEIRLSGASDELEALLAFCGLGDLFRTPREPRSPPPA